MTSISYLDYFLPNKKISIDDYFDLLKEESPGLLKDIETVKKYFINQAGFGDLYIEKKENLINDFELLIERYLKENSKNREQVKYIFYTDIETSITHDYQSIAMYVRNKYEFNQASVLLIDQQCASCIWTIGMTSNLLRKGERALLLTANVMSSFSERYKPHSIISDGAGLIEISYESKGLEIVDFDFKSKAYIGEFGISNNLEMMKTCANNMKIFLSRNNIQDNDLSCIIHQNLSKEVYETIFELLMGIENKKLFWDNIKRIGHIGDADLIFNTFDALNTYNIENGKHILLYAIGEISHSANYNCVLLKMNR